jgi:D-tyrosyl-tRNA(Tyr) deacylase
MEDIIMVFVIQRVRRASVAVDGRVCGKIDDGLLVLAGVYEGDTKATADKMVKKLCAMRIFADANGKTNLALADVGGSLLIVSQFTLCADMKHGNRPSFTAAAGAAEAEEMYQYILAKAREYVPNVQEGIFGADMKVDLLNDGPFTIILDSDKL